MTNLLKSSDAAVEALFRHIIHDDHKRGCGGREYTCTCGYDAETTRLGEAADAAILAPSKAYAASLTQGAK